jgi:hypothetical protein
MVKKDLGWALVNIIPSEKGTQKGLALESYSCVFDLLKPPLH